MADGEKLNVAAVARAASALRPWLLGLGTLSLGQVDDLAPKFARAAVAAAEGPAVVVTADEALLALSTLYNAVDGSREKDAAYDELGAHLHARRGDTAAQDPEEL